MNKFIASLLFLLVGCGPSWGDCESCKPSEDSAESVDGSAQVPVDVNVVVVVNDNSQHYYTDNVTSQSSDAGVSNNTTDGGSNLDGGIVCRNMCVCMKKVKCDRGWHNTDKKGRCRDGFYNKCLKEEKKCE
jgi:hypothetical protein